MSRSRFKDGCIVNRAVPSGKWKFSAFVAGAGFMNVYGSGTDNVFDNTWRRRLWKKSNVRGPAPKGDLISKELAVSLKRYPDTKPFFPQPFFRGGLRPKT